MKQKNLTSRGAVKPLIHYDRVVKSEDGVLCYVAEITTNAGTHRVLIPVDKAHRVEQR